MEPTSSQLVEAEALVYLTNAAWRPSRATTGKRSQTVAESGVSCLLPNVSPPALFPIPDIRIAGCVVGVVGGVGISVAVSEGGKEAGSEEDPVAAATFAGAVPVGAGAESGPQPNTRIRPMIGSQTLRTRPQLVSSRRGPSIRAILPRAPGIQVASCNEGLLARIHGSAWSVVAPLK